MTLGPRIRRSLRLAGHGLLVLLLLVVPVPVASLFQRRRDRRQGNEPAQTLRNGDSLDSEDSAYDAATVSDAQHHAG